GLGGKGKAPAAGARKGVRGGKPKPAARKPKAATKGAVKPRAAKVEPAPKQVKYEKRFVDLARRMFIAKVPDDEIADFFGVDAEEMEWWKEEHPDFGAAFRPDPRNYGGRPTVWDDRNITVAGTLASLGATDLEISQAFEVSIRTIHRWKLEHPEFREALELGKEAADKKVEESLFKRATGYSFDSEKIVVIEGEAQRVEIIEHVPPDVKAGMWWLQNRRPGTWRDVRHIKHDVDPDSTLGSWLSNLNGSVFKPVVETEDTDTATKPGFGLIMDEG
uniref:hypothetical protein n=1 Tax=Rhizobium sp. 18065 TaxID=2681411 RepID=UPI00190F19DD